jgi:hypothetical protein
VTFLKVYDEMSKKRAIRRWALFVGAAPQPWHPPSEVGLYVTSALDFFHPAVSNQKTTASVIYTEGGMNLLDALRHAEQQGKKQVQRGAEKLHNVETSLRRKFEHHAAASAAPYSDPDQEPQASSKDKGRTGIVSVHGRDVGEMRCTGGRRSA